MRRLVPMTGLVVGGLLALLAGLGTLLPTASPAGAQASDKELRRAAASPLVTRVQAGRCAGPRLERACRFRERRCMGERNDADICAGVTAACDNCMRRFRECEGRLGQKGTDCGLCIAVFNDCGGKLGLGQLGDDGNWLADTPTPQETIERVANQWVEGEGDISTKYGASWNECTRLCLDNGSCQFIEYFRPEKKCSLFSTVRKTKAGNDADVGIRR